MSQVHKKGEIREVNKPSESMLKYYSDLFKRNQRKWMRRSKIESEHLGTSFVFEGTEYVLLGTVDTKNTMLIRSSDDRYFFVHSDVIDQIILSAGD